MKEITLRNFRCFHHDQTARLAPLTLLVGENSTGKTSFLAMVRALYELAYRLRIPDFRAPPYDLGSYDEVSHHRGGRRGRAGEVFAAVRSDMPLPDPDGGLSEALREVSHQVTFRKLGTAPYPVDYKHSDGSNFVQYLEMSERPRIRFGTRRGSWEVSNGDPAFGPLLQANNDFRSIWLTFAFAQHGANRPDAAWIALDGSPPPERSDLDALEVLCEDVRTLSLTGHSPYAGAPVQTVPKRTYDPSPVKFDNEGRYVPMYLASECFSKTFEWAKLKHRIEVFGQRSGLFDELAIRTFDKKDSAPFQLQVRKFSPRYKGPMRNLIDVGYGVSQALPILTELFRTSGSTMFLFQQPEIHLHPKAQAELGTLFCSVAGGGHQLFVETHSDHILDRIRMEVRDGGIKLGADGVSILFFERGELDVQIHSLRISEEGNILDAPKNYRKFFQDETTRSLGL